MELLTPTLAIVLGFVALVWGADRFVMGAAATARNLGVSPLVIGLTIVGFSTSAPEMLVSSVAALEGAAGLSVGNAIGSNITNVALVLGVAALVSPLQVPQDVLSRELPVMLLVMLGAGVLLLDGHLGRVDGVLLLAGMVAMVGVVVREGLRSRDRHGEVAASDAEGLAPPMGQGVALLWLLAGLGVLLAGSNALVWGATTVARHYGVSELVIGLTIVDFGTSLPELAATVVAGHGVAVGPALWALALNAGEVLVLAAVALLFSSFSTPFLTGLLTLGVWLVGRSAGSMGTMESPLLPEAVRSLRHGLARGVPNYQLFVPGRLARVAGPMNDPATYVVTSLLYALAYAAVLMAAAAARFRRRDFP